MFSQPLQEHFQRLTGQISTGAAVIAVALVSCIAPVGKLADRDTELITVQDFGVRLLSGRHSNIISSQQNHARSTITHSEA